MLKFSKIISSKSKNILWRKIVGLKHILGPNSEFHLLFFLFFAQSLLLCVLQLQIFQSLLLLCVLQL
jgi:hypothetical protein